MRYLRAYLPVILWMLVIFTFSTDVGSSQRTSRIIGPILRWFNPEISDEAIHMVQLGIRKTAHLTVYAILAALMWRSKRQLENNFKVWRWKEAGVVLGLCIVYALSDEWHQTFVGSRQGATLDVLIDTLGASLGLAAIWIEGRIRKHW